MMSASEISVVGYRVQHSRLLSLDSPAPEMRPNVIVSHRGDVVVIADAKI
jgi:hypothetical protein